MKIPGYSERGILNALVDEIRCADDADALFGKLIETAKFPRCEDKPPSGKITFLNEHSFSEFGEPDAIALISSKEEKCAIFIEAKVKTWAEKGWFLHKEFSVFANGVELPKMPAGFSSNLFTQLYYKQQIVQHSFSELEASIEFPPWSFTEERQKSGNTKRKVGKSPIVHKVIKMVQEYCETVFYLMLIPDSNKNAEKFFEDDLPTTLPKVSGWDASHYGYLTWATVEKFCGNHDLKDTLAVFKHNEGDKDYNGQIYKKHQ
ncbi:hypothetical protein [Candidatus Spongiihabitans sp.]|uniref:hypothetical protein n=1 Tax=Candidatus Spongiihabitans sp. TaxID=3101308 RepID=UPI003C7CFAF9